MPVWKERRHVYRRSYLLSAVFSLFASATALAVLGVWAGRHSMTLTALAMTLQAVIAALRLSDFYPEADLQTQLGMIAHDAARDFERSISRFREPSATGRPAAAGRVSAPRAAVNFANVTFRYPGESQLVFDGLELEIPAGQSVAIVGANGAGKTTLVKLLTRMYEPASGAVLADGVDIRAMPLETWRKRVAVVFQDFLRYEVSVSDNIAFGAVDHLDDSDGVWEAARKAGIAGAVARLPAGFDTPLTRYLEGGVEFSGGQWQRVALARAFFAVRHGARILVLDEPTASLDIRAETQFFTELMALTRGVTTIIISHRFSTVRNADTIVTLEKGRAIEQGTHQELLRLGGRYAEMFRIQAERFTDSAGHYRGTTDSTWDGEAV
jgi:ATP-binding cassette subfamily B protein